MKKLFFLLVIAALALTACNGQATEVPATADAFIITNPANVDISIVGPTTGKI